MHRSKKSMTSRRKAAWLACSLALGTPAFEGLAQDPAQITITDRRETMDIKGFRDSVFSAIAFVPDKAVKPSAIDQLKAAISARTDAPIAIELTELRVIDYFPTRIKAGPGGLLSREIMKSLVNSKTDWSFVASLGISNEQDSIICLLSGTLNGKPVAAAAHEPYRLSAFAGLVRSDKHFKASVTTCIDRLAQQALEQATAPPG